MNIVFLDYDGVVNTLMFGKKNTDTPYFNFPDDGKVNNYQAVKWLEKLCKEFDAKIVVTSTWRLYDNYKECLYNGGLSKDIEIIGRTDDIGEEFYKRPKEIKKYLNEHKEIEQFVILDDEWLDVGNLYELNDHLVKTETYRGFDCYEYEKARFRML